MIYRYAYILQNEIFSFGAVKYDEVDLGPIPFNNKFLMKKLTYIADKLGRRLLDFKRVKGHHQ